MTISNRGLTDQPITASLRLAILELPDSRAVSDLLFLERWEMSPLPGPAFALRVNQIRRANPVLAAAIRSEIAEAGKFKASA